MVKWRPMLSLFGTAMDADLWRSTVTVKRSRRFTTFTFKDYDVGDFTKMK